VRLVLASSLVFRLVFLFLELLLDVLEHVLLSTCARDPILIVVLVGSGTHKLNDLSSVLLVALLFVLFVERVL
jgi:hypothetical protein